MACLLDAVGAGIPLVVVVPFGRHCLVDVDLAVDGV